ncbi:hypothetical protein K438DRAFT_312684 [Mycena galopus ATCC 62051]|nr:hypothetical protein K438DRAFT_312684 [Mycena galopus ATCC 62051]
MREVTRGQRFDESLNVSTSMRNLGRSKAHIDSQLMLEALAITSDVFEEDLLELRAKDPKTLTFPIRLHIKPHALELPVFRNANKTDSLTYSAAAHLLTKIKKVLRWSNFSFFSLRYSFASAMVDKLSEVHLRYLMGHTRGSKLSTTTYQVPDRVADVSGTRFDEENTSFAAMAQMHSSVSWNRPPAPPDDKVKNDIGMKKLVTELSRRQKNFESKFGTGKTAQELFQDGNTDQLVVDVLEITAETLEHYMSLSAGSARQATTAPATSSASSDDVEEATTETSLFDSMLDAWAATDATHPFLAIVANNAENPRLAILQRYLAMIHQDDQKGSRCVWCFTDPTLTPEEQTKDHSQHYVQHVLACEKKHHPNTWRCPICLDLIPTPPKKSQTRKKSTRATPADDEMGVEEIDAIKDALEAHAEGCYGRLLALVRGEEEEETDVGESDDGLTVGKPDRASAAADSDVLMTSGRDSDVSMAGLNSDVSMLSATSHRLIKSKQKKNTAVADGNDGARVLSIQVPIAATGHTKSGTRSHLHSLFFCPICLFDKSLSFCQRLIHFPNVPKLMDHFPTHWKKKNATEIDYKKTFICGLPPCIGTVEMDTGKYITHLHKQHDYKLIQCAKHCDASSTCDFQRCSEDHHNPSCFTLPKKFYHHNDALLLSDDRFPKKDRIAMPDATLVDYRKTDVMTRWYTWIFTKHKVSKEFAPKVPEKQRPKVVNTRAKPVSSTPVPVANPFIFLSAAV